MPLALIGAGALAATGFQPLALWPFTLGALAFLIVRIELAGSARSAALAGWLFGLGHFTLGNNWIATAFTYQAAMPAWLGWIAVVLLAIYLAIYPALAAFLAAWLARRTGAALLPAFAGFWVLTEYLRATLFTGFAWNPLAMAALGGFNRPGLAAIAPWTGTYALSGLIVLLAGFWLLAWRTAKSGRLHAAAMTAAFPVALMLLPWHGHGGEGRLAYTLVQPNIGQDTINDPSLYEGQFQNIARLSLPRTPGATRIVLWPEGGLPDYLRPGYPQFFYNATTYAADPAMARARIGKVIGPGSLLLTGATDLIVERGEVSAARNVVTALGADGAIRGSYAKAHLVPYGEYLPMRAWLAPLGLSRLVSGSLDFLPGPGPRTLDMGVQGKAGLQICYEIVFSGEVADRAHRPDYIFNPSNDGWFGAWGPPQHLAQARMRAIEEGIPVLRSTTTGISAVIDADGVVRQFVPRLTAGRLDGLVPPAHASTLFARLGNRLALAWALLLLGAALVVARRRRGR
ncbi:apolipoprotein N-acyltransferase [Novosphingobium sp.]|uniref:apolipoprotein N-acyltransferase n=1 Tax=Novosphingobium sp. TaxID=1874826 RepID=UPI001D58250C|nr:apolipoprotein N-acyltransferase [Novosphingobium sp.]MBX9663284.1 apolipoprotein N-acyltransferase [Novosphingobium sp.]